MLNWVRTLISKAEKTAVAERPPTLSPEAAAKAHAAKLRGDGYLDQGNWQAAAAGYREALASNPSAIDASLNLGFALLQLGHLPEAGQSLERALALEPDSPDARYLLGLIAQRHGNPDKAADWLRKALEARPDFRAAYRDLCHVLFDDGKIDSAREVVLDALGHHPEAPEFHFFLGNIHLRAERTAEAIACLERALALQPDHAEACNTMGSILQVQGRMDEALEYYRRATTSRPDYVEALINLANALAVRHRYEEALAIYIRAFERHPDSVEAILHGGNALVNMGRHDEALEYFDRVLLLEPGNAAALCNRGMALYCLSRFEAAVVSFERLLKVDPDFPSAEGFLLAAKIYSCNWSEYAAHVERIGALLDAGKEAIPPFNLIAIGRSAQQQLQCARIHAGMRYPLSPEPVWTGERYRHDRIRVAYLSADYHEHATTYLMAGLIDAHDRQRFEIIGISFGPDSAGPMRARLKSSFDRFLEVRQMGDREVAALLRELEIDIAVDLKGFTTDGRPGIFAQRGAPLQVSYLGYPGTLGMEYMDYIVADGMIIPPGQEGAYAENVVRLPDTYQVNDAHRRIAEQVPGRSELGLPDSGFVFCSFNNNYKITPYVFDVWMSLLKRVDGSVLWLLEDNAAAARNLRKEAVQRGIDARRLVFGPRLELDRHLARHRHADLFLDTLPCNAHTTTSDALWAGLPVLTCTCDTFAGRVAASLLRATGLNELITHDLVEYETLAYRLATTPGLLEDIRARLARTRATSPLFDSIRFARHLESAYETMWHRHQRGEPPEGFDVEAISGPGHA
jgi:protein O-GlcNAc transferase